MRVIFLLCFLLVVLFVADISFGSVYIPFGDVLSILFGGEGERSSWTQIVLDFRVPRAITALIVGGGLSVCGLQMQVLFRNPLAGPFVLGISSGASLGVALVVLTGIGIGLSFMSPVIIALAAAIGSALVFILVIAVSAKVRDSTTLLIFGLMFGSATGAIVSVLQYFSKAEDIQIYLLWTFGSLGGVTYEDLQLLIPLVLLGLVIGFLMIKSLNALLLGETYASSLGVNVKRSRLGIIISASILAGSITAFCGPIAFIGIAIPHLTRILLPTSNHQVVYPVTIITGAIALIACDIISQLPGSQLVLPINAVTALVGAPVVIWIVLKSGNIKRSLA